MSAIVREGSTFFIHVIHGEELKSIRGTETERLLVSGVVSFRKPKRVTIIKVMFKLTAL